MEETSINSLASERTNCSTSNDTTTEMTVELMQELYSPSCDTSTDNSLICTKEFYSEKSTDLYSTLNENKEQTKSENNIELLDGNKFTLTDLAKTLRNICLPHQQNEISIKSKSQEEVLDKCLLSVIELKPSCLKTLDFVESISSEITAQNTTCRDSETIDSSEIKFKDVTCELSKSSASSEIKSKDVTCSECSVSSEIKSKDVTCEFSESSASSEIKSKDVTCSECSVSSEIKSKNVTCEVSAEIKCNNVTCELRKNSGSSKIKFKDVTCEISESSTSSENKSKNVTFEVSAEIKCNDVTCEVRENSGSSKIKFKDFTCEISESSTSSENKSKNVTFEVSAEIKCNDVTCEVIENSAGSKIKFKDVTCEFSESSTSSEIKSMNVTCENNGNSTVTNADVKNTKDTKCENIYVSEKKKYPSVSSNVASSSSNVIDIHKHLMSSVMPLKTQNSTCDNISPYDCYVSVKNVNLNLVQVDSSIEIESTKVLTKVQSNDLERKSDDLKYDKGRIKSIRPKLTTNNMTRGIIQSDRTFEKSNSDGDIVEAKYCDASSNSTRVNNLLGKRPFSRLDREEIDRIKHVKVVVDDLGIDRIQCVKVVLDDLETMRIKQVRVLIDPLETVQNEPIKTFVNSLPNSTKSQVDEEELMLVEEVSDTEDEEKIREGPEYQAAVEDFATCPCIGAIQSPLVMPPLNSYSFFLTSSDNQRTERNIVENRYKDSCNTFGAHTTSAHLGHTLNLAYASSLDAPDDIPMWKPSIALHPKQVDAYIKKAKRDYSYREDQALGLLFHHKYNIDIAYFELSKYYNLLRKEWSIADKDKFEKLMTKHKKNFDLIQANLPHKSIREIICYYYDRKVELKKKINNTKKPTKPTKSFLKHRRKHRSSQ